MCRSTWLGLGLFHEQKTFNFFAPWNLKGITKMSCGPSFHRPLIQHSSLPAISYSLLNDQICHYIKRIYQVQPTSSPSAHYTLFGLPICLTFFKLFPYKCEWFSFLPCIMRGDLRCWINASTPFSGRDER